MVRNIGLIKACLEKVYFGQETARLDNHLQMHCYKRIAMFENSVFPQQSQLSLDDDLSVRGNWFSQVMENLEVSEGPGWPDKFGDRLREWNRNHGAKPIRVLSLFSGAGGLDIGFHDAGFDIVECNEIEKKFAKTLSGNSKMGGRLEGSTIVCSDIKNYHPESGRVDFIIGGPPCQTFSAAGARASGVKALDDERGYLFKEYVRLLNTLKPRGFLFENVYRIVGAQQGKPWQLIQEAFREAGYNLFWRILDTADYGVPQCRERLIIVGLKSGEFKFPMPTHGPDSRDAKGFYTAGVAVSDIEPEVDKGVVLGGRHGHLLKDIPPGLNYSFYTDRMGHPTPIFGWRSKFSDYLYKADPESPIRTLKAQGGQYTGPFHWDSRSFTLEEFKRLQTFPDSYNIVGSRQDVIHQLGNSVPPQFARVMAMSIKNQVFKDRQKFPMAIELMDTGHRLNFRARKAALTKTYMTKATKAIEQLGISSAKFPANSKGWYYGYATKDFQLVISKQKKLNSYDFQFLIKDGKWQLHLGDPDLVPFYKIFIKPDVKLIEKSPFKVVEMSVTNDYLNSPLLIWKFLEYLIQDRFHKDDLVQLFGYYQYKQNYSFEVKFGKKVTQHRNYWSAFEKITEGVCVGENIHMHKLAVEYDMPKEILLDALKHLKSIGYEIRNSNTNPQIKKDTILIPYSFPSLNQRSLQRLTDL